MDKNVFDGTEQDDIFRDPSALNPDRTPNKDEFVKRDEEMNEMVRILRGFEKGNASSFLVTGPSGTGKTMAVKIILRDLNGFIDADLQTVYMADLQNELQVLRRLSKRFDLGHRGTGLKEYYDRFADMIIDNDLNIVIVLDEIEQLLHKQRRGKNHGNSFLKKMLEVRKQIINADTTGKLVIIGISNNTYIEEAMSPKVISRFGHENIFFSKYDAIELREILERRQHSAFQDGAVDQGVISKTAAIVGQNGGDAREAIKILRTAGEIAVNDDQTQITTDHVDQAKKQIEADRTVNAVKTLSKQSYLVTYAILNCYEDDEVDAPFSTGEIYNEYQDVADQCSSEIITQRRVRDLLSELDMLGVFRAPVESKGRYGRTSQVYVDLGQKTIDELREFLETELLM